jgi:adenylyltransferase/sulfurtransferase
MLSQEEWGRYARQMVLPGMGPEGQEKLKRARVLVVGAGGLGCPVLLYLAAAGVGTLGIADGDVVSPSNLHRQVLYGDGDVGRPKAETAARRLREMNPLITVSVHPAHLSSANALDLLAGTTGGGLHRQLPGPLPGQRRLRAAGQTVRVRGHSPVRGPGVGVQPPGAGRGRRGPTYRCLFPEPPPPDQVPNCAEAGVLGVLPGVVGLFQATEVVKALTGHGKVLGGELLVMDLLETSFRKIRFRRTPRPAQVTGLIDYETVLPGRRPPRRRSSPSPCTNSTTSCKPGKPWPCSTCGSPTNTTSAAWKGPRWCRSGTCGRAGRNPAGPAGGGVLSLRRPERRGDPAVAGGVRLYQPLQPARAGIDAWAREIDEEMERY